ncbi:protein kinase domain-containing protein [Streptacidiphilus rugosus]|uniref:protein kinase domain-containing protein n=1 Tax=Streptacidiphilus rugosus TaxID=405783 RepID=UPI00068ABFB5|nr:protein kinase [Streptacidiphilus rugosus]
MEILQTPALGDRYLLCELLGSGGMAEVHRARDLRLDRTVAVKILRPELAADPVYRVRFGREARAAASLNHPCVVAVFDSGEGAGRTMDLPYLVMEYLPGRTLSRVLADEGPLPAARSLRITADLLDALDHAHRHGMVHRDVKPANVMVADDGAVKLMDFGIARSADPSAQQTLTAVGMVVGTADYLSPEQARGEPVDARSDLYAVGCLLHELLTGEPPLTADTALDTIWRRLREDAPVPSLLAPALSPAVDVLVSRALARDPGQRFPDAATMRDAVVAVLDAEQSAASAHTAHTQRPEVAGRGAQTLVTPLPEPATPSEEDEGRAARRGGRRTGRKAVLATVGVVVVASLGAWIGFGGAHAGAGGASGAAGAHGATTSLRTPDLTQLSLSRARHLLQGMGLRVGHVGAGSCSGTAAAPHTVCAQQPAAGTTVSRGTAVDLSVSRAPGVAPGA